MGESAQWFSMASIEKATAGQPVTLKLKPFEVLVMEFSPK